MRTKRFLLRSLQATDATTLFATVYGDPVVMEHVAGGAHASQSQTEAAITEYIDHEARNGFTFWGIEDRETSELLGDCGLYLLEGRGPEVEFGVTLRQRSWGMGVAAECGEACIEHAFQHLGLHGLVAVARAQNTGSTALLQSLGFEHEGSVDVYGGPHERYALGIDR
ncbi:MAG: family N-acetyltransferase [Thermoleophilia bacterium]|nr:family N-acetyltransferase [Thermoleophilia bacterium]